MSQIIFKLFLVLALAGPIVPCSSQAKDISRIYAVAPLAQTKDQACWAAAAAMLLTWKRGFSVTEREVAQEAGGTFLYAYNANNPLAGVEIANFASKMNFVSEVPANYSPENYFNLLESGPLWVGTAILSTSKPYGHVRVISGLEGDGTFDGTILHLVDPDGGREYTESVAQFGKELEVIAAAQGQGGDLFPQVIRLP